MTATTPRVGRLVGLDQLRGLAVALMVLDHALLVLAPGAPWAVLVRLTVTRASLPLFCVLAGVLLSTRPRWERLSWAVLAGIAATLVGAPLGIGQPDVLLVLALALAVAPWVARRGAWWALAVAILQPFTWPLPITGYQPGAVLALVLVGTLCARSDLAKLGARLPRSLALVGRYPLSLYVAHLAALYGLSRGLS